jgi:hypothetical protein
LRFLRPTNVHSSSSSSTSQRSFYRFGHRHARHPGHPDNAALHVTFAQQHGHSLVLRGLGRSRGY